MSFSNRERESEEVETHEISFLELVCFSGTLEPLFTHLYRDGAESQSISSVNETRKSDRNEIVLILVHKLHDSQSPFNELKCEIIMCDQLGVD